MTLQELLQRKPSGLIYVNASTSLIEAIEVMCVNSVGSLLVQSDDGELLGIATERDILRYCSTCGGNLSGALIDDAMTRDLIVATPDQSIDEAMSLMTDQRFRHLPVLENGKPVGMISIGDLVKAKLKDVTVEVRYLRDYISA
jgi:CBS domain-containing protein